MGLEILLDSEEPNHAMGGGHLAECWIDGERGVETASFSQICDD